MLVGDIPRLNARRFPSKTALVCGDSELTWSAVDERANRIGSWLLAQGLQAGDRVAVVCPNVLEWPEISFGVSKAGLVLVPVNVRLTVSEITFLVEDSGARALIFDTSLADTGAAVLAGVRSVAVALEVGGSTAAPLYESALAQGRAVDPTPSHATQDDLRALLYTSGTTGLPKAVMHTHRTMLYGCLDAVMTDRSVPDDRYLAITPFFTSGGAMRTLSWTYQGQTMVILPKFDPGEIAEAVKRYAITHTIMVPTMLQRLVAHLEETSGWDLSSLTRIGYGSAPAAESLVRRVLDVTGTDLWQRYGQTEVAGFVTMLGVEDHRAIADGHSERARSCGRESPYAEIQVLDDNGTECPPGEPGELVIRSDAVSPGYWNRPDVTAERFRGGGLHTGDIAYRDADGYLYLVDRKNDLIISGAFNIYPGEIERVLATHAAVESVAVFGVPHPEWGESPHAAVVLRPGHVGTEAVEAELRGLCRRELAGYKQPGGVSFHDEFPVSGAGKVLKAELRKRVTR
ncbi:MAG: hypothetical protein JWO46_613 [Nocardioidaceae bacterium]|nr:hypothetical protein [Nocardioidaceae bacterium]